MDYYFIFIIYMNENFLDAIDWMLLEQLQRDASLSNQALAEQMGISPPTCLRRVRRLREAKLITSQVAILNEDAVSAVQGHGLTAIAEVSLDHQADEHLSAFEQLAIQEAEVTQCYRVTPGPDFILMLRVADMPGYQALAQRLFTQNANVRNVKVYFSVQRSKFDTRLPLRTALGSAP